MEWQPFGTAPRDGTPILVWGGEISYDDSTFHELVTQTEVELVRWQGAGWCAGRTGQHDEYIWVHMFTHWMPLPAPPAVAKE